MKDDIFLEDFADLVLEMVGAFAELGRQQPFVLTMTDADGVVFRYRVRVEVPETDWRWQVLEDPGCDVCLAPPCLIELTDADGASIHSVILRAGAAPPLIGTPASKTMH